MRFSIVTVCFNAENDITKTIESVLLQSCKDYEYIIIDGASTDSTLDVVKSYAHKFKEKGLSFIINSEPDSGIYDAMNKGIAMATGQWIIFLNAGDVFYNKDVLALVSKENLDSAGVVYGNTIFERNGYFRYAVPPQLEHFKIEMPICHQSVFVKTILMKDKPFNLKYKICADYDFLIGAYLNNVPFIYVDIPFSIFSFGGISSSSYKSHLMLRLENMKIRYKHGVITFFSYIRLRVRLIRDKILSMMKCQISKLLNRKSKRDDFYLYDNRWIKGLDQLEVVVNLQSKFE